MREKYLKKLEYDKVLKILSNYAKTYIAKDMCINLIPFSNVNEVIKSLSQTNDAIALHHVNSFPDIFPISDICIWEKPLESYSALSVRALLEVASILKMSREFQNYYMNSKESIDFASLKNLFENIYVNYSIESKISSCIAEDESISDKASPSLFSIRKKQKSLEQDVKDKLNSFIHSSTYSKFIQEPIVTIKNDRFVIPVKEEYRNSIKGFIHDISSSGATVFMEPISVFETNNQINSLKFEENIEIEKILKELSLILFPVVENLKNNIAIITELDMIFAKAKYSMDIDAIQPIINNTKNLDFIKARHPLINKDVVVPIDINVGIDFNTLVITGPNTGGKTVALKTVGLLVLMACSGMNIPADENSSMFVFDNVFADIGDDQNITESLSTFSSHILNIVEITKSATTNSLILLDELGSGTDPEEGSSLAISILKFLNDLKSTTIATTHYPEVKNYAIIDKSFKNASCEFDLKCLKPTYKLLMGIPGKSNAFSISEKLGLDKGILLNAKELIASDNVHIEDLLNNIYNDKIIIEQEKENMIKNSNQIELLRKSLENEQTALKQKKQELLENAKIEAREILLNAKDTATNIIHEMQEIQNSHDRNSLKELNNLRNSFNESIKDIHVSTISISSDLRPIEVSSIFIGMNVFVKALNQSAVVLSLPNKSNKVQIQVGNIKTNTTVDNLFYSNLSSSNPSSKVSFSTGKAKQISTEINVIGYNVEEAIYVIDKYLDDASLSNVPIVTIVHGKGTGTLKKAIHIFLNNHPHVKSFRSGVYGEGEGGVTIVELK